MNKTEMKHFVIQKAVEICRLESVTKSHAVDKIRRLYEPTSLTKSQQSEWYKLCNQLQEEYKKMENLNQ